MKRARVSVECDGCGRTSEALTDVTVEQVRYLLGGDGWLTCLGRDFDLCPECAIPRVGFYIPRELL